MTADIPCVKAKQVEPSAKHLAFVEAYLQTWNATEAARRVGSSKKSAYQTGYRMLKNVEVRALIGVRLKEMQMGADEVLARLADMASGGMDDFFSTDGKIYRLDLQAARDAGKMHLVKKVTETKFGLAIELHDPQAALVQIGRYHKLFVDRQEHSGTVEIVDAKAKLLSRFAAFDAEGGADSVPGSAAG
jgi:phage terminase small subunit